MRTKITLCLLSLLLCIPSPAFAAPYPDRAVQFIVGMAAGGGADLSVRSLCRYAEPHLGQPINIVNTPGGSGAKGYANVAKAKPDGYTIGVTASTISTLKPMGILPLSADSFEHIMVFSADAGGLWVNADAPWKNFREFVEYVKSKPGQVSIAASNPGSITRFQMLALEREAGIKFRVLSQEGGAANGLLNLAGNHVEAAMGTPSEGLALYQAGKIRSLGFAAAERIKTWPNVPTFTEQGYNVVLATTRTIIAPKGTPRDKINVLYKAFAAAANDPGYIEENTKKGLILYTYGPDETAEFLKKQDAFYLDLIRSVGLEKKAK